MHASRRCVDSYSSAHLARYVSCLAVCSEFFQARSLSWCGCEYMMLFTGKSVLSKQITERPTSTCHTHGRAPITKSEFTLLLQQREADPLFLFLATCCSATRSQCTGEAGLKGTGSRLKSYLGRQTGSLGELRLTPFCAG